MRALIVVVGLVAGGCVGGSPGGEDGRCRSNDDCAAGEVCIEVCRQVCVRNTDCPGDEVCSDGLCAARAAGVLPRIDRVEGNGRAGPGFFRDRLIVYGRGFSDGAVALDGAPLSTEDLSDTRVVALLPADLLSGDHTLTVTNQAGADQTPISLLADPATPEEVLALLVQVDGVSSGLDADLLDGRHAVDFAAAADLANFVTSSALTATLADYAALADLAGMVTADGGGNVTLTGELIFAPAHQSYSQVMPSEFHPSGDAGQHVIGRDWFNGVYKLASQTGTVYAHPRLPHGARVTSFSCAFRDQSAAGDPTVIFFRQMWGGGSQEAIAQVTTSGASTVFLDTYAGTVNASYAAIDLNGYFYYLYGNLGEVDGTSVMIRRCKIGYTYDRL